MKTTSAFRLSREVKRQMSMMQNGDKRRLFKELMIEAQLEAAKKVPVKANDSED